MGDYDRKPLEPPSQFLRLKSKGEQIRIRIASSPYRELKVWAASGNQPPMKPEIVGNFTPGQWMNVMSNPDYDVSEAFHFVVIDRADSAAKVFSTTGGVYGKIRQFATDPEWGDPKSYDLTIIRTEQPGKNYYEVTPSPNKSDLSLQELDKADALNVLQLVPTALPAAEPQPDDFGPDVHSEPLPWQDAAPAAPSAVSAPESKPAATPDYQDPAPKPGQEDAVIDDINLDEPINLDDIPFKQDPDTSKKGAAKQ